MSDPRNRGGVNRRRFLRSVPRLAAVGGAAACAGCVDRVSPTGPRTPPRSPESTRSGGGGLVVTDFADEEGEDGTLVVRVTVENRGAEAERGTVVVEASAGDAEETVTEPVTAESGERTEVVLGTSLSFEEFSRGGSLRVEII